MRRGMFIRDVLCPVRENRKAPTNVSTETIQEQTLLRHDAPICEFDPELLYRRVLLLRRTNTEARFITVRYPRSVMLAVSGACDSNSGNQKTDPPQNTELSITPLLINELKSFHSCLRTVSQRIPTSVATLIPQLTVCINEQTISDLNKVSTSELYSLLHWKLALGLGFSVLSLEPRDAHSLAWVCTTPAVHLIHIGVFTLKHNIIRSVLREKTTRKALLSFKSSKAFEVELMVHVRNVEAPEHHEKGRTRDRDVEAENEARCRLFQEATRTRTVVPSFRHVLFTAESPSKPSTTTEPDQNVDLLVSKKRRRKENEPVVSRCRTLSHKEPFKCKKLRMKAILSSYREQRRILRLRRLFDDFSIHTMIQRDPKHRPLGTFAEMIPIFGPYWSQDQVKKVDYHGRLG